MKFFGDYFVAFAWVIVGLSIVASPTGRVLQMQFAFGEYKYLAGFSFVLVGVIFFWLIARKKKRG